MALPTLESFDTLLDRTCADVLGDAIQYAADGVTFAAKQAHVDYADAARAMDTAEVFEQDMTLAMVKADVPARPTGAVRITLPKVAGKTFKPVNVRNDASGTHWVFELKEVVSA